MFNSVSCTTSGMQDRVGLGMIHLMILTVSQVFITEVVLTPVCQSGQKLRQYNGYNICCYTTSCERSQKFKFCTMDQEHDICVPCPQNYFTNDPIDTSQWDTETDICARKPQCNPEEIMIGNDCQCNLGMGYYGNRDRCHLDDKCKVAGFQLQSNGNCDPCDNDHFKPEVDGHGICRPKTSCKYDEIITNPGSPTTDRMCLKVNVSSTTTQSTTTVPLPTERPKPESDTKRWVVPVIIVVVLLGFLITAFCIYKNRKKILDNQQLRRLLNRCRCCKTTNEENQPPNEENQEEFQPMLLVDKNQSNGVTGNNSANGSLHANGSTGSHNRRLQSTIETDNKDMNGSVSLTNHYQEVDQTHSNSSDSSLEYQTSNPMSAGNMSLTTGMTDLSETIPKRIVESYNTFNLGPSLDCSSILDASNNMTTLRSVSHIEQAHGGSLTRPTDDVHSNLEKQLPTPESGNGGNIPTNLFGSSLVTTVSERSQNETAITFYTAVEKQPNPVAGEGKDRQEKKNIPVATVTPIRSDSRVDTECPINTPELRSSTGHSEIDPNPATTVDGNEVHQATNEHNHKVVANTPYGEFVPQENMNVRGQNNGASAHPDTAAGLNSDTVSQSDPWIALNHTSPIITTDLGQPLLSPESDGSHGNSMTNDSSRPQDNEDTESIQQPDH